MSIDLDTLHLAKGAHGTRQEGVCLLEAVAWFVGKEHTDRPPCVSPVLGAYGRGLNDVLPDAARQQLVPYVPQLPGTAGDGKDERRGFIALDWLVRTWLPAWCDLVPALTGDAVALRALPRIADLAAEQGSFQVLEIVRGNARAAWDAARDAARAAARDAAWDAAGDAAGDAAWDAAWAAAGDAAGDAARAAAGDAAWDAAWAAARDAARAAARAAAGDAAGNAAWAAAGDAAWAAARGALAPTVATLQESAVSLFAALIAGEWPDGVQ